MSVKYSINVTAGDGVSPFLTGDTRGNLRRLRQMFHRLECGSRNTQYTLDCRTGAVAATGTVTIASGSGSITATINGVAIAVTWATSDTATATALAAAIVASTDPLVQNIVTATSALGVVTITASVAQVTGNAITLAASGTGATASGARLTGGLGTVLTMVI